MRNRLAYLYLAAGVGATALYFALPWGSFAQTLLYDALGVSAAAASVAGARSFRPSLQLPWYLFGAGMLAFAFGDVLFNHSVAWVADAFYLAGYPFLTLGLVLLVRSLRRDERRSGRLEASMLITAFALCQWIFLMQDQLQEGTLGERAVAVAYPAMDIVLLAGLVFFSLTPTWRTVSYRYLVASVVLLIFADELYGLSPDTYAQATWLDAAWLLSYVLWGVAALHPSMRELSEPARGGPPRVSPVRVAMLSVALATAPALLLVQVAVGSRIDAVPIAVGAALLCALVLLRLVGVIHTLDRLRADEQLARAEAETAQRLLTEQNERLRETDRLKDEFVALISHDLRTPLTSITGYVELALEEDVPDEVRGFLQIVSRNAERLLTLVNDLLFVARLQAGELSLEPREVELADVVRETVEALEPRAAAKRISISCVLEPVPPVHADRGRVQQVLENLVSNALKFTPEGGTVSVSLSGGRNTARVEVSDSGIGISPEDQRRLFERFFRATNAVSRQVPGTGLGLYISRVIADAHAGTLTVRSELGSGSTFSFELPVERVAALV